MACSSCSRMSRIRAGPSTFPSIATRTFSATSAALARPAPEIDLTFPTKPHPDPFEIFHFSRSEPLDRKAVKSRYLDLVRKYHPDRMQHAAVQGKGKGKAKEESIEFKQIVAAYELLSDPKRRASYLNFGLGWGAPGARGGAGGGAGGSSSASPWSQSTPEYHFRRGRPMSSTASGDRWSGTWDYTWTDPHNPHFRPERAGGVGNPSGPGWEGRGTIGKNGFIFLGLAGITFFISPLTAWYSFPSVVSPEEMAATAAGDGTGTAWIPRMYDKRHLDAATNLHLARTEARQSGQAKLEAFRRRAKQIEREKAFERAREVQAIERSGGTGHLALPPPSD